VRVPSSAPWFGRWQATSNDARYKRIVLTISPLDHDRIRVAYDMVGIRGGVNHLEWTGRFDGADYPVHGLDYVMTNAYSPIDDRSCSILIKVEGRRSGTTLVTISPDNQTLTAVTSPDDSAQPGTTVVYERL
jgi:hypothetical protein